MRSLRAQFAEHRETKVHIRGQHVHTDSSNHTIMLDNTKILSVESKWFERGVNEARYIWVLKPSPVKDGG